MATNAELIQSILKAALEVQKEARVLDADVGPVHDDLKTADELMWSAVETAREGNSL